MRPLENHPRAVYRQHTSLPNHEEDAAMTADRYTKAVLTVIALALVAIAGHLWMGQLRPPDAHAQTVAFATIIFFEIFHALNARSWDESLFSRKFFSNWYVLGGVFLASIFTLTVIYWAPLQAIFGTVPLSGSDWMPILFVSSMIIFFIEVQKTFLVAELKERSKMDLPKRQVQ